MAARRSTRRLRRRRLLRRERAANHAVPVLRRATPTGARPAGFSAFS
jgi:hypothetical protein